MLFNNCYTLLQEWKKTQPSKGICSGAPATTATLQKSVLFAGSDGVNTLLLVLLPKPHPCYQPLGSIAREGHQGLKPHSRHAFAASSYLTRCYLSKDVSAASPAGEEREKAGHYWRAAMPPPSVTGKAIAFAEMRVKSPLIPSTSMCPFAVGHAFQSRHPGRARSAHHTAKLSRNLIRDRQVVCKVFKCQLG